MDYVDLWWRKGSPGTGDRPRRFWRIGIPGRTKCELSDALGHWHHHFSPYYYPLSIAVLTTVAVRTQPHPTSQTVPPPRGVLRYTIHMLYTPEISPHPAVSTWVFY